MVESKKMDTTPATSKTIPKVPEVLLKKRKVFADLKARRLRSQVQANKVKSCLFIRQYQNVEIVFFFFRTRNTNV